MLNVYSNINFKPWIGATYLSHGYKGKRIIVLGESHYCKKDLSFNQRCYPLCKRENMRAECFSQTNDVIENFIDDYRGYPYQQTFLCFERAVVGKVLTNDEREKFWNSVIFYNYIQFSQERPRCTPPSEHWENSELAFKELLETYMPDCLIVWGSRLYGELPDWNGEHSRLQIGDDKTDIWTYTINGKCIPAMKVYHPSTPKGKSWKYWHEFYDKFLVL